MSYVILSRYSMSILEPKQKSLHDVVNCQSDYDPSALPVEQAQQIIQQFITPIHSSEKLAIREALGRTLAEDIISNINVPAHDNSAMDGYALCGADLTRPATHCF